MPLEIAPHAKDRDSQRQELEQITHVYVFFFSGSAQRAQPTSPW